MLMLYCWHMKKGGLITRYMVAQVFKWRPGAAGHIHDADKTGFTILEVMIVLAVTGALFISAASLISGRQNKTEFTVAINNIQSQIQQVISDVGAGFYPSANDIQCTYNGATNAPKFSAGTSTQGTNQDCTFMGKAIEFGIKNTDPEQFWVYSLAGLRQRTASGITSDVQSVAQANPKVMAVNSASPAGSATAQNALQNGLTTGKMTYTNSGTTKNIVAVAFISDLSQNSSGLVNGAQAVNVVPIVSASGESVPNTTQASTVASINANVATGTINPNGGVVICFVSGTTNQYGLITIGGGNERQNAVTLTIGSTRICP